MEEIQTKHLDMQLGGQPAGADHRHPRGAADAARGRRRARQGADRQHRLDRRQGRPGLALDLRRDQGGGDQLHPVDPPRGRQRRDPVHGAGARLRRHADDRVRQGAGAGRGNDPAGGPRRGGPLPPAHLAQLPCAGDCLHPTGRGTRYALRWRAGDGPRRESALPRCRLWRPRSRLPRDLAGAGAAGAWPRGGDRDLGGAARGGRGCRARLCRGRGIPDVPAARSGLA